MPPVWTRWPDDLQPARCPVVACNELMIEASPEAVWAHLIAAPAWPEFYANAREVAIEGGASVLGPGAVFTWKTFGISVRTRVEVFEPGRALAWRGDQRLGHGMHTWAIEPMGARCLVVTEEVQRGFLPSLGRWYIRRGLRTWHQRWLEGLRDRACGTSAA